MNLRLVCRMNGIILLLLAASMVLCGAFAFYDVMKECADSTRALFRSAGITGLTGFILVACGGLERMPKRIARREAVVVVGTAWLLSSLFGGLPYLLCPPYLDIAGAFFESASGFTTTGSSVMTDIETWPRGILLWRSITQWLGGIGILVLFVAVLSALGVGSKSLFQNESSFRGGESGMARIQDNALLLLKIYLGLTTACVLGLRILGLSWYMSINHAMTAVSTGGFSPHNTSIGYYSNWGNGWQIELWIVLFMFLCSLNFLIFVVVLRKNWQRLGREDDARWFAAICLACILAISAGRTMAGEAEFLTALREAAFIVITIVSTTGFGTVDYETWPSWSKMVLALLMLMGGCAGSTAGGFKVGRLMVFVKSAYHEIIRAFRPSLIFRLKVNGNSINEEARGRITFFLLLYLMIVVFSTLVVGALEAGTGISMETCGGAVLATLSNIGPGFGSVGPTENFGHLRDSTHVFLGWLMILGRLELFAILVLLFPSAWRKY
jgi:trk system potassium uptake protein TrkH